MKKRSYVFIVSFFLVLSQFLAFSADNIKGEVVGWKAGVASTVITPEQPMWLAGYGSRVHPSEGILHDLWAKALVLEDADGKQAVLVTTDILGMTKEITDRVRSRLKEKFNLSPAQIMINSSHTHSGPVLRDALVDIYPLNEKEIKKIEQYTDWFEQQIIDLVGAAYTNVVPVHVYSGNGVTRFQVNRRNNNESTLLEQTELKGPNDYAVPVLRVEDGSGKMKAIVFGYACHPTVLNGYEWSGDYPGFAQLELENKFEGVTAMFFQGAGADMNPLPRRSVALAQQYGRDLASAVERVLNEDMQELSPTLTTSYSEINLPFSKRPKKRKLKKIEKSVAEYQKHWATRMLNKLENGESFQTSYPYPLQIWHVGEQKIFGMGGEVVIGYTNKLKQIFGHDIFVLGYTNDVMGYIPTSVVLKEGGYEGASSQMVYGLPALWKKRKIEPMIINEIIRLSEEAAINIEKKNNDN